MPARAPNSTQFAPMIEAYGVYAQNEDAFSAAEKILRESGIMGVMSTATDPEEVARYENVQELINSIKDFVESQKEIADSDSSSCHCSCRKYPF